MQRCREIVSEKKERPRVIEVSSVGAEGLEPPKAPVLYQNVNQL
jgi:hypothetical protein